MNISSLQIFDDFLSPDEFKTLSDIVLGQKFPWFFGEHVSMDPRDTANVDDPLAVETCGFNHSVFEREWAVKSFTYDQLEPLFKKLGAEFGFTQDHLIRARLSMKFQKQGFTSDHYNIPHVDYYYPHESFIFYLNDTDGDTRIFDQWHTYSESTRPAFPSKFTTQARVTPKANRLVWINGLQYHTASNPIHGTKRIIININLQPL
jgi:hypothetical protein